MQITLDMIVEEVRNLAAKNPDFDYTEQEGIEPFYADCSYLAAITIEDFEKQQSEGGIDSSLDYHTERLAGRLGQRCIVGQALLNLGITDEKLQEFEGEGAEEVARQITNSPRKHRPLQAQWLEKVQQGQDIGFEWGRSVALADEWAE